MNTHIIQFRDKIRKLPQNIPKYLFSFKLSEKFRKDSKTSSN